jgi:hypothetical protein
MMRPVAFVRLSVAALVLASAAPALADGVLPSEATAVQREQAQSRFQRGKELMGKKLFDEALVEFRASHDIVASPNARLEAARCLLATGKLIEAYAELGRTTVEAKELVGQDKRYQLTYDSATAERADLQPKLGFVSLTIDNPSDGTRVVVGGEEIRRAAWTEPAPVLAGTTEIVIATPGHADVTRSVTLTAGQSTALTIDAQSGENTEAPVVATTVEPPPVVKPNTGAPLRPWAVVAGGVGLAGIATFAVFGSMAHSDYSDLQTTCGTGPCPSSKADEISSGKSKQLIANVGLAVGVVGAVAGTTLFVLSLKRGSSSPGAAVLVAPAWLGVGGKL